MLIERERSMNDMFGQASITREDKISEIAREIGAALNKRRPVR
jgi:hypothetical protein